MRLVLGKSYIWIFWIFVAVYIALGSGVAVFQAAHPESECVAVFIFIFSVPILIPIVTAFMLVLEIRSGIALDSYFQAKYPRGTGQYQALLAWHAFALIALTVWAAFFVHLFPRFAWRW